MGKKTYADYLDDIQEHLRNPVLAHDLLMTPRISETIRQLKNLKEFYQDWVNCMSGIDNDLKQLDLAISDKLHILEISDAMSDQELLAFAKELRALRIKRRIAKNEKEIGTCVLDLLKNGISLSKIQDIETFLKKKQDPSYHVRVHAVPGAASDVTDATNEMDDLI